MTLSVRVLQSDMDNSMWEIEGEDKSVKRLSDVMSE
jgi:hypothetical protein